MLKNEDISMYDNIIKNIVKKHAGFREKDIMKTETWNSSHKVLNIIEKNTLDHKNGFSVDLVTRKICG